MIGAFFSIFVAIWFFKTAIKEQTGNAMYWAAAGAALFFVLQYVGVMLEIYLIEVIKEDSRGFGISDRADKAGESIMARVESILYELTPILVGLLTSALVRVIFLLKQKPSLSNLFSGVKDVFSSSEKTEDTQ